MDTRREARPGPYKSHPPLHGAIEHPPHQLEVPYGTRILPDWHPHQPTPVKWISRTEQPAEPTPPADPTGARFRPLVESRALRERPGRSHCGHPPAPRNDPDSVDRAQPTAPLTPTAPAQERSPIACLPTAGTDPPAAEDAELNSDSTRHGDSFKVTTSSGNGGGLKLGVTLRRTRAAPQERIQQHLRIFRRA